MSLAGLIIFFARKFSRAAASSQEEDVKNAEEGLGTTELRTFTYQKKILIVIEKILGIFVSSTLKIAMISSRLLGRVKIRTREVHKASDFVSTYFEKLKKRKHLEELTNEERECINLIKQNPTNVDVYKRLGNNYFSRKNYQEARLSFEQVLRLSPDDEETKARLEQIKEIVGESELNKDEPA